MDLFSGQVVRPSSGCRARYSLLTVLGWRQRCQRNLAVIWPIFGKGTNFSLLKVPKSAFLEKKCK